jgi:hypothetical protein
MNTRSSARPCSGDAPPNRMVRPVRGSGLAGAAAAALLLVGPVGVALPALGQTTANRLGLCTLDAATVTALQGDVGAGVGANGVPEVAFVVVYSINNDNNGQPIPGGTTGPVLCTNPNAPLPLATPADTDILGIDILDSAEAFLLRFEGSGGTTEPETRFCHTTNANVDCYLLGPPPPAGE